MVVEKSIGEFSEGDKIQNFFIIKSIEIRTNKNNKRYIDLNLGDKTGEVNGKIWDANNVDETLYRENMLVKIRGKISQWQSQLQLNVEKIRPIEEDDGVSIENYVQGAPFESQWMYDEVLKYLEKIDHMDIYVIVETILKSKKDALMYYPAAKSNHHAIRGGLLYHVLTMLRMAEGM